MTTLHLDSEAIAAAARFAETIAQALDNDERLLRAGSYVHRSYIRALLPAPHAHVRELRWRRFVNALAVFVRMNPRTTSPALSELRQIVAENADLLDARLAA